MAGAVEAGEAKRRRTAAAADVPSPLPPTPAPLLAAAAAAAAAAPGGVCAAAAASCTGRSAPFLTRDTEIKLSDIVSARRRPRRPSKRTSPHSRERSP